MNYHVIRELYTRLEAFEKLSGFHISHILDLGSGYGRLVIYGTLLWPNVHFYGIEMVLERVLEAQKASSILGLDSVEFFSGDAAQSTWPFTNCFIIMNSFFPEVLEKNYVVWSLYLKVNILRSFLFSRVTIL